MVFLSAIKPGCQLDIFVVLLQVAHAAYAEAPARPVRSLCQFSPQPALGKPGAPAATGRLEAEAPATAICHSRQTVLGDSAAALAGMEAGVAPRATGDSGSLAPGRLQVVLDVALAA